MPFRRVTEDVNEIELLIMVTPEFVDAMEPHEVPRCYPGSGTMSPDNHELYCEGKIEVPNRCSGCGACGCVPTHGHEPCCPEAMLASDHTPTGYAGAAYDHSAAMPGMQGMPGPHASMMSGGMMMEPGMEGSGHGPREHGIAHAGSGQVRRPSARASGGNRFPTRR